MSEVMAITLYFRLTAPYLHDFTLAFLHHMAQRLDYIGADSRIRTCDPLITNEMLYQLSYTGVYLIYFNLLSLKRQDSFNISGRLSLLPGEIGGCCAVR